MVNEQPQRVVVTSTKSMGLAILLTVLFGPVGMFYSTIPGALVMMGVSLVIGLIGLLTLGLGLLLLIPMWPISIIWTAVATNNYNKKLLAGQRQY